MKTTSKTVWRVDAANELPGRGTQRFYVQGRSEKDLDKHARGFEASGCTVDWTSKRTVEIAVEP